MGDGVCWSYDSGPTAGGVAIDSGAQDLGSCDEATLYVTNADAAARNVIVDFLADDGTTVLFTVTISAPGNATNGGSSAIAIGLGATGANNVAVVPALPRRKMRFRLAAGGASNGRLAGTGR